MSKDNLQPQVEEWIVAVLSWPCHSPRTGHWIFKGGRVWHDQFLCLGELSLRYIISN